MSDVYTCVATGVGRGGTAKDLVELDKFSREKHAVVDGKRYIFIYNIYIQRKKAKFSVGSE